MKAGKVPPKILKSHVYPYIGKHRKEVLVHSGFGEDCSVIDFGETVAVLSTDPITGADNHSGYLSVFVSCNDIAACGAEPVGILVTLLLPIGSDEILLKEIMEGIHTAANQVGIEVLGGHSEITPAVTKPVVSATALGIAKKGEYVTSSGARPGDDVIITKYLGLEGSAILTSDFEDYLKDKLPEETIKKAQSFIENISVIEDGLTAAKVGVSAMHDITEGGFLGASYEVATASGVGMEIIKEDLPILPETLDLCRTLDIDPLGLISSGSMLMCAPDGDKVLAALKKKNIPASIVGKVIDEKQGIYIVSSGKKIPCIPPERDELIRAIEHMKKF